MTGTTTMALLWLCAVVALCGHFATAESRNPSDTNGHGQSLVSLVINQALQLQRQQMQLKQQASQLQQHAEELSQLERKVASMENEHADQNLTVAFSAYISDQPSVHAAKGSAAPFRGLLVNAGGGYSTTTSAFTAPIAGEYYFIVHADCSADFRALDVVQNGKKVFLAHNDNRDSHVTGAGIMTLQKGDVVTTRYFSNAGVLDAGRESTFSGFWVK